MNANRVTDAGKQTGRTCKRFRWTAWGRFVWLSLCVGIYLVNELRSTSAIDVWMFFESTKLSTNPADSQQAARFSSQCLISRSLSPSHTFRFARFVNNKIQQLQTFVLSCRRFVCWVTRWLPLHFVRARANDGSTKHEGRTSQQRAQSVQEDTQMLRTKAISQWHQVCQTNPIQSKVLR